MDGRLNTQLLEQYESVFRTRGFRKASRELDISHNTIRKNIDQLEIQIGKPLLASKTKPLQFTPLGERIGECLMEELKLLTRLTTEIQALSNQPTEVLVGFPEIEAADSLYTHLIQFSKEHPNINIEFADNASIEAIASGTIHVGLFIDRPSREPTIAPSDLIGGVRVDIEHAFYSGRGNYPDRLIGGHTEEEWNAIDRLSLPGSISMPSKTYGIQSPSKRGQLATAGYGIACLPTYGKEYDPTLMQRTDLPLVVLHSLNIGMSSLFTKSRAHRLVRSFLIELFTGDPQRLYSSQPS